jgi:Ca2+-binding RTX toxin-like protein
VAGSAWKDVLTCDDGASLIRGSSRNDILVGLGGNDELIGGLGTDNPDGGDGIDECEAEVHNCEITILSATGSVSSWFSRAQTWRRDL